MSRRRTTLKDVAEAVGVHVSTVSRALNPETRHYIRPEVARKILEVSDSLNYRPNAAAYSLRTNRTRTVGVVIPDIANPVFPPIIRGIEDALAEAGYVAILVNTDARAERQATLLSALSARGVDGLIIASILRDDATVPEIAAEGIAVVTVNRRSDDAAVPSVTNDDEAGMARVLRHLKELGHSRVATIAGPQTYSTAKDRYEAFERHRVDLELDADPGLVVFADAFNEAEGEQATATLLDRDLGITAIVASNDRLAVGALAVLKARGIDCPRDISLTGFNDMPMVDRLQPPLTTIRVQQYEVGRRAAGLILAEIAGRNGSDLQHHEHVVMPVELIVRGSTAPPNR